eukprot:5353973-Alexandrium_andersonii.AAC.1
MSGFCAPGKSGHVLSILVGNAEAARFDKTSCPFTPCWSEERDSPKEHVLANCTVPLPAQSISTHARSTTALAHCGARSAAQTCNRDARNAFPRRTAPELTAAAPRNRYLQ